MANLDAVAKRGITVPARNRKFNLALPITLLSQRCRIFHLIDVENMDSTVIYSI
jgi:hypothetical protein